MRDNQAVRRLIGRTERRRRGCECPIGLI